MNRSVVAVDYSVDAKDCKFNEEAYLLSASLDQIWWKHVSEMRDQAKDTFSNSR